MVFRRFAIFTDHNQSFPRRLFGCIGHWSVGCAGYALVRVKVKIQPNFRLSMVALEFS